MVTSGITGEHYTSETIQGSGPEPFYGGSLLAYFMPLELEVDYDPTSIPMTNKDLFSWKILPFPVIPLWTSQAHHYGD